jgi:chitinase
MMWDDEAQAPFAYSESRGLFATFDDQRSVAMKTQYARDHKLGGIMFWELAEDRPENGLLTAIVAAKVAGSED